MIMGTSPGTHNKELTLNIFGSTSLLTKIVSKISSFISLHLTTKNKKKQHMDGLLCRQLHDGEQHIISGAVQHVWAGC